ncbi:8589_t:CDS:1, partial [Rhizophagus irregularis]
LSVSLPNTLSKPSTIIQVSKNVTAQNQSNAILQEANARLCEYTNLSKVATSLVLYSQFASFKD